ncbi:sugar porter family MFS transporter [Parachryseolinea silvisoli]|uniref:sugar porter family MFS transporter n=1 Tax=Parachryseolinea silvisoli TaxID=2873601 RepID=UPI002265D4C6|nr:sugar porter family MFS transporter [Parachryseolinea silvisoli]MCD9017149.1 sugar porter family MFS transporter [Parachryseolinea silvisoli]
MNKKRVFTWSVIIALGGFLFGLDTAVISGAEQKIQQLWDLDVFEHGLTVSIALIGTVVGAMLGGIPSDKLGRKKTLFWIAVIFLVSSVGSALAIDWFTFLGFRFLGGLGVGCSSVTAPMYISELAPASHRGRLVAMFQFNVVAGILLAFLSNYLLQDLGDNAWRWMLGVQAFPSLIFLVLVLFIPESPRWLVVKKNAPAEARAVLVLIDPDTADQELRSISQSHSKATSGTHQEKLFSKKYAIPVMLAVTFAVFNQVSGINAIIYYAPRIFEMTGLGADSALLSTAGLGVINFIFTLLAVNFIDRYGRRTLMLIGSFGVIITLALVANAFYTSTFNGYLVPVYLCIYIAFFAFSQGAVIWVFISEIFPNEVRAKGQALGSFTHWLMATLIAFTFPYITEKLGGGNSFLIFTVMMVFQLIFVWKVMPETKGKSLEEVESMPVEDKAELIKHANYK